MKRADQPQLTEPVGIVISRGWEPEKAPKFSAYIWGPFQRTSSKPKNRPSERVETLVKRRGNPRRFAFSWARYAPCPPQVVNRTTEWDRSEPSSSAGASPSSGSRSQAHESSSWWPASYAELEAHGIAFRPPVYLSDQWGCPDGTPLIGVPFYLADSAWSDWKPSMPERSRATRKRCATCDMRRDTQ